MTKLLVRLQPIALALQFTLMLCTGPVAAHTDWVEDWETDEAPARAIRPDANSLLRLDELETQIFGYRVADEPAGWRLNHLEHELGISNAGASVQARLRAIEKLMSPERSKGSPQIGTEKVPAKPASKQEMNRLLKLAVQSYKAQDFDAARGFFEEVLRFDPNNIDANFSLGSIYERENSFSKALQHYRQALAENPGDETILQAVKDIESKLKTGNKTTGSSTDQISTDAIKWAFQQGNYGIAENLIKDQLRKLPDDASLHFALGQTLLKKGDTARGITALKQAQKLEPENKTFQRELQLAQKQQDYEEHDQNTRVVKNSPGSIVPFKKTLNERWGTGNSLTRTLVGTAVGTAIGMGLGALAGSANGNWRQGMAYGGSAGGFAGGIIGLTRF